MHELYDNLYELCEMVEKDLTKTNEKLRMSGGELSGSDLEYVDKLTHTLKSIKATMAMIDAEGEESYYSRRGGSYYEAGQGGQGGRGGSRGGNQGGQSSYYREGGQGGGSSYARGRGRNARRDSRGRYSRNTGGSYYRNSDEFAEQVEELMQEAPNEQIKQRLQQLVQELDQMQM